jgi:hypothetical protein
MKKGQRSAALHLASIGLDVTKPANDWPAALVGCRAKTQMGFR